jgi:hypothetical protein
LGSKFASKQNTTKAQGSPYLSRWIIRTALVPRALAHQQNYPHRRWDHQVLSHEGSQYQLVNLLVPEKAHIVMSPYDSSRTSPIEVAAAGTNYDLVDRIVSHSGKPSRHSAMRFRTRWLGYGPDDDTQQSYASLKEQSRVPQILP